MPILAIRRASGYVSNSAYGAPYTGVSPVASRREMTRPLGWSREPRRSAMPSTNNCAPGPDALRPRSWPTPLPREHSMLTYCVTPGHQIPPYGHTHRLGRNSRFQCGNAWRIARPPRPRPTQFPDYHQRLVGEATALWRRLNNPWAAAP